jgi:C-terminal processing protease CtpA/Prc
MMAILGWIFPANIKEGTIDPFTCSILAINPKATRITANESGVLVGARTFGKGLVQTVFNLGDKEGVKLTTNKYLTPDGHDIHAKGIEPDVVVEQPKDVEEDLQLKKAAEVLEKQLHGEKAA